MYHRSSGFNYVQYNYIGWWLAWNLHAICSLQSDCFIWSMGNSPIRQNAWQKSQYQVWVLLETAKVKTGVKLLDLLSPYSLEGKGTWFTNIMIVKESLTIKMYNKYRQSQSSSMKNMKMYMYMYIYKKKPLYIRNSSVPVYVQRLVYICLYSQELCFHHWNFILSAVFHMLVVNVLHNPTTTDLSVAKENHQIALCNSKTKHHFWIKL